MIAVDIAKLVALAKAATPWPWTGYQGRVMTAGGEMDGADVAMAQNMPGGFVSTRNAAYIAVSPDVALALAAELEAGQAAQALLVCLYEHLDTRGILENHGHRRAGSACADCELVNKLAAAVVAARGKP